MPSIVWITLIMYFSKRENGSVYRDIVYRVQLQSSALCVCWVSHSMSTNLNGRLSECHMLSPHSGAFVRCVYCVRVRSGITGVRTAENTGFFFHFHFSAEFLGLSKRLTNTELRNIWIFNLINIGWRCRCCCHVMCYMQCSPQIEMCLQTQSLVRCSHTRRIVVVIVWCRLRATWWWILQVNFVSYIARHFGLEASIGYPAAIGLFGIYRIESINFLSIKLCQFIHVAVKVQGLWIVYDRWPVATK